VRIGARVLIAAYCYLIGGDHDFSDASRPVLEQPRRSVGITVGEGAWLGAGANILDGVEIGSNAIIGAGAVVRESVPSKATAVGVPARIVGARG
jgi:acetyltransferase-like isoleucine patch superfamily enzyme